MANWSAIGALGTAASGAGDYFGKLGETKRKAEVLAQARAMELADKADERSYQEGLYKRDRADGKEDAAAARVLELEDRDAGWKNDAEVAKTQAGTAQDLARLNSGLRTAEGEKQHEQNLALQEAKDEDNVAAAAEKAEVDRQAALFETLNNPVKLSSHQTDLLQRAAKGKQGIANLEELLANPDFDVTSSREHMMSKYADNDVTRGAIEKEWRQWDNAVLSIVTQELRTDSGAALTNEEIASYSKRIGPQIGDTAEEIRQKIESMKQTFAAMDAAGDPNATPDQIRAAYGVRHDAIAKAAKWAEEDLAAKEAAEKGDLPKGEVSNEEATAQGTIDVSNLSPSARARLEKRKGGSL